MKTVKLIFLDQINFKLSPVVRAQKPNEDVIQQYARAYNEKRSMPPIVVFYDASLKVNYLADGIHRCAAIEALKRRAIMAEIHEGPFSEALRYALMANTVHGVPRSYADRRQCVHQALLQWADVSNVQIATMADVDDKLVAAVRKEMEEANKIQPSLKRKAADGRSLPSKAPRKPEVTWTAAVDLADAEEKPWVVVHEIKKDALGVTIPNAIVQYWDRSQEINLLLNKVSEIIGALKAAGNKNDVMYGEINITGTIADLEKAYVSIRTGIPYSVCTACAGHPETQKSGCRLCLGRGMISKFRYDALVPKEIKDIAKKKGDK